MFYPMSWIHYLWTHLVNRRENGKNAGRVCRGLGENRYFDSQAKEGGEAFSLQYGDRDPRMRESFYPGHRE